MKRRASRPAPYEVPAKLNKRTTSATVGRKLSMLNKATSVTPPMPPPKWPSVRNRTPVLPRSPSLPLPAWPDLVPTSRSRRESDLSPSGGGVTEVSEEPTTRVPGLRRMSTLPLEEEERADDEGSISKAGSKAMSKTGSKSLSKTGSTSLSKKGSSVTAVATLEKKDSVVTLEPSGTVTTVTRLPSGSSIGETTGLALAPPSIRKELSKASSVAPGSKGELSKKVSSIRVYGTDAPEEEEEAPASLRRGSSSASKAGSISKEPAPSSSSPSVPLPPGGLIEIVFSFDTTGSMSTCIDEVRGRVGDMIQRLQADIPGIRIAVVAHGDYCDAESFYVIKWIDFGASVPELCNFVQTISGTGGGDFDECYELVLARAQTELSWTPGSQRSLVMIGDATPHPFSYYDDREEKLDWKEEAAKLAAMDVKIYAVQAMNNSASTSFYQTLARVTRGHHLKLDQFNNIFDMLMVLCYNERGADFVQAYEDEVRTREGSAGLHKDLEGLFSAFRGGKPSEAALKVLSKGAAKGKKTTPTKTAAGKGKSKATGTKTKGVAKPRAKPKAKAAAKPAAKKAAKPTAKKSPKSTAKKSPKSTAKSAAKAAANKAKGKGVKSVKGRKPTKAGTKKTKTTKTQSKKPVPGVKRQFREVVKDEEVEQGSVMQKVQWTEWMRALTMKKPTTRDAYRFKDRDHHSCQVIRQGLRNMGILQTDNAPAVYEVAVQLKNKKRYVVFFKACSGWRPKVMWDTVLLHSAVLHKEVNTMLFAGAQIWLRRGNVSTAQELAQVKKHLLHRYDYAWNTRKVGRGGHAVRVRQVKKCNILISGNSNK